MSSDAQDAIFQPGQNLAGRYIILDEIGRGGFGTVYRAVQEGVDRNVAIKTLRKGVHEIPGFDFAESFRKEAKHTSRLRHPNTITVHDYGETPDGVLYLVMEYLEGETLYERMWREQVMDPKTCVHIAKQIAKSLAEAHDIGIIHGDLKPANVFLCTMYGERDFVKVLDFGITKLIGEVDPAGLGTPEYMSPEQFAGQPLLASSDIYALGLIMYEMLIGQRPFEDKDTRELARKHLIQPLPAMPADIEQSQVGYVIRRACAKEPARRFENGWVLFEALEAISLQQLYKHHSSTLGDGASAPLQSSSDDAIAEAAGSSVATLLDDDQLEELLVSSIEDEDDDSWLLSSGAHPVQDPADAKSDVEVDRAKLQVPDNSLTTLSTIARLRPKTFDFQGRSDERRWFVQELEDAIRSSTSPMLLVGGAAGAGKSRLAEWLIEEADLPDDLAIASGHYREGSPLIMEGLSEALTRLLAQGRDDEGLSPSQPRNTSTIPTARTLERDTSEFLGRDLTADERHALQDIFGPVVTDGTTGRVRAIVNLMRTLADVRPIFIHLDNIQFADTITLDVLHALAQDLADGAQPAHSLILHCSIRREALPAYPQTAQRLIQIIKLHPHGRPIKLDPMKTEDTAALIRDVLASESKLRTWSGQPEASLLGAIAERSHGNPQYAIELTRHLVDIDGIVADADGFFRLHPRTKLASIIPPRIAGFYRLRLAQLEHRHRRGRLLLFVLTRCALLGDRIPYGLIVEFLDLEARHGDGPASVVLTDLRELLTALSQEDLLVPDHTRNAAPSGDTAPDRVFTQPILRQILHERITKPSALRDLHALAARAKQNWYSQFKALDQHAAEISDHYLKADSNREALTLWIRAAREALLASHLNTSVRLLEQARLLAATENFFRPTLLRLLVAISYFQYAIGAYAEVEALQYIAMKLANDLGDNHAQVELSLIAALAHLESGPLDKAQLLLEEVRAALQSAPPSPPLPTDEQNEDLALRLVDLRPLPRDIALGLTALAEADLMFQLGRVDASRSHLKQARDIFQSIGFRWGVGHYLTRLGRLAIHMGRTQKAQRLLTKAEELLAATTPPLGMFHTQMLQCEARTFTDPSGQVRASIDNLRKSFEVAGDRFGQAHSALLRARLEHRTGHTDEALIHAKEAIDLSRTLNGRLILMRALLEASHYHIQAGQFRAGFDALQEGALIAQNHGTHLPLPELDVLMGLFHIHQQNLDAAARWLHTCIDLSRQLDSATYTATAFAMLAYMHTLPNSPIREAQAADLLRDAIQASGRVEHTVEAIVRAQEAIAQFRLRQGQHDLARPLLNDALEGWRSLGNLPRAQSLQALIRRPAQTLDL